MAEFLPPHAFEQIPWDRPEDELGPPDGPDVDGLAWNERWNQAAYDPDYPLPPSVARAPAPVVAGAAAAASSHTRFGRPIRAPEDMEADDPYDEYAPVADDLEAPGQLTWTGGTVPLRAAASFDGPVPEQPAPYRRAVEPPTWSRGTRSVFGDYFVPGKPAPSLPSPDRAPAPAFANSGREPSSEPKPASEEWPPVPTDFKPQWSSVAPIKPAWSAAPPPAKLVEAPAVPPTWVESTSAVSDRAPSAEAMQLRLPAPPPPPPAPATRIPPTTPVAASVLAEAQVKPVVATAGDGIEADAGGPSTISTLFWMAVTGIVVVGLVLAFLHFLTGAFR
jgi:hypothetical protein